MKKITAKRLIKLQDRTDVLIIGKHPHAGERGMIVSSQYGYLIRGELINFYADKKELRYAR